MKWSNWLGIIQIVLVFIFSVKGQVENSDSDFIITDDDSNDMPIENTVFQKKHATPDSNLNPKNQYFQNEDAALACLIIYSKYEKTELDTKMTTKYKFQILNLNLPEETQNKLLEKFVLNQMISCYKKTSAKNDLDLVEVMARFYNDKFDKKDFGDYLEFDENLIRKKGQRVANIPEIAKGKTDQEKEMYLLLNRLGEKYLGVDKNAIVQKIGGYERQKIGGDEDKPWYDFLEDVVHENTFLMVVIVLTCVCVIVGMFQYKGWSVNKRYGKVVEEARRERNKYKAQKERLEGVMKRLQVVREMESEQYLKELQDES